MATLTKKHNQIYFNNAVCCAKRGFNQRKYNNSTNLTGNTNLLINTAA